LHNVDLWLWSLDIPPEQLSVARQYLAECEIQRAKRFVRKVDHDRYISGRARLREILGAETGCKPEDIAIRYGPNGKPEITDGPDFNLSHSGRLAALAISYDGALGVDVEEMRPIEDGVARHHFSATEYHALSQFPQSKWLDGFYRCWTRKEAVIKSCGLGLSMPLNSFDVTLSEDAQLTRIEGDTPSEWSMLHFEPMPGWAGAVAVRSGGQGIQLNWRASF